MKFLVLKKITDVSGNKINNTDFSVKDMKVIDLDDKLYAREDMERQAIETYREITNFTSTENCEIVCSAINKGVASLKIDTYYCKRVYPDSTRIVTVHDKLTGSTYPAVMLVGVIPAGHVPTDDEILNLYFRGDARRMELSDKLGVIKLAVPFDRISIDLGGKSMVIPVLDRFEIEYLE